MTIAQSPLAHVHVRDVMNTGILTTDPSTSLRVVARLMSEQRVHAVAVADADSTRRPWGIVSTSDVVAAAAVGNTGTAGGTDRNGDREFRRAHRIRGADHGRKGTDTPDRGRPRDRASHRCPVKSGHRHRLRRLNQPRRELARCSRWRRRSPRRRPG
jgi:hypothetical protein